MATTLRTDKMLYLDMEMTCWGAVPTDMQPEIIQIGVAELDVATYQVVRRQGWYVRPQRSTVSAYCTELTHITPDLLRKEGRPLVECLRSLKKSFSIQNKMVCAWGDDVTELVQAASDEGMTLHMQGLNLGFLWNCTTQAPRRVGLQAALGQLGLAFEGRPHDAVEDAVNTARLHAEWLRRTRGMIPGG